MGDMVAGEWLHFQKGIGSAFQRVSFQLFQGNELDRGRVRRFEIYRRGYAASQRLLVSGRAKAPFVPRLKAWESPFRMRGHEIVPLKDGVVEKLARHLYANRMLTDIFRAGSAIAVPKKAGHRIATAAAEFSSKNVGQHGTTIAHGWGVRIQVELVVWRTDSGRCQSASQKQSWPIGSLRQSLRVVFLLR